jgi:hypothetical protein
MTEGNPPLSPNEHVRPKLFLNEMTKQAIYLTVKCRIQPIPFKEGPVLIEAGKQLALVDRDRGLQVLVSSVLQQAGI